MIKKKNPAFYLVIQSAIARAKELPFI